MDHIIQLIQRGDKGIDIDKLSQSTSTKKSKSITKTNPKLFKDAASYAKHIKIRELLATESKPTDVKLEDNYMYTMRKKHYSRGHSLMVPGMMMEPHPKGSAPIVIKLRASSPLTPSRSSLISSGNYDMQSNEYRDERRPNTTQSGSGWLSRPTSEMIQNSGRVSKPVVLFRPPLRFITYGNTIDTVSPTMRAKTIGATYFPSPIKKEEIGVTTLKEFFLDPYAKQQKLPKPDKHKITMSSDLPPPLAVDYEPIGSPQRTKRHICRQTWT